LHWKCFQPPWFLSNLGLPWKTECALNSRIEYIFFIIQDFWATCGCPEVFLCIEYIFYHSGCLGNQRLPWKQSLPWKFSSREGPQPLPPRTPVNRYAFSKDEEKLRNNVIFVLPLRLVAKLGSDQKRIKNKRQFKHSWNLSNKFACKIVMKMIVFVYTLCFSTTGLAIACMIICLTIRLTVAGNAVSFLGWTHKEKFLTSICWIPKATVQVIWMLCFPHINRRSKFFVSYKAMRVDVKFCLNPFRQAWCELYLINASVFSFYVNQLQHWRWKFCLAVLLFFV